MKPTRFAKILAVVLVVAMLPLWLFGCGQRKIGEDTITALTEMMVGDGKLSYKNEYAAPYLTQLDADVKEIYETVNTLGGWQYSKVDDGDLQEERHYKNTYKLALAWATKGSNYYHDSKILNLVESSLEFGYINYFGLKGLITNENRTLAERENIALHLVRTIMLIQNKLSKSEIKEYLSIIDIRFPAPTGEGLDLLRSTYITVVSNILVGNEENAEKFAKNFLPYTIGLTTEGNGLYADGSYIWNINTVNTLDAGVEAAGLIVDLVYALDGTDVELIPEAKDALYNWVISSMRYSMYNGTAMISALGANIMNGNRMGGEAIEVMLKIAMLCEGEQRDTIYAIVKSYAAAEKRPYEAYLGSFGTQLYVDVVEDDDITAADTVLGAHSYAMSDSLTVHANKFSLSLSMSSVRTNKYQSEKYHYEETAKDFGAYNGNLWYSRDGMLTLYTASYQIPDNYWEYVNAMRVPGTTVDNRERTNAYVVPYNGISNYAGSAVIGNNAVSAMLLANNNSEYLSTLTAKKSWFVFDNKIVCLGADIDNSTQPTDPKKVTGKESIETVIENIFVKETTEFQFGPELYEKLTNKETVLTGGAAMFVFQYGGIYVPSTNSGILKTKLNKTDAGNFLEVWLEHGLIVSDASYEYAIYPFNNDMKAGKFYETVTAGDYEVLANTADVQAVKDKATETTGYTFWKAGTLGDVTVDFACNVLVKVVDNQLVVAVSDISHNSLDNAAGGTVTVNGNTITVDRAAAANGQTLTFTFAK